MKPYLEVLSKSIQFGDETLKNLERKKELPIEHKVIIALYRKLLEQVDGNYILADHELEGPARVLLRSAMETFLSLIYILQEKRRIQDRAFSYYVGFLKAELKIANNPLTTDNPNGFKNEEDSKLDIKEIESILNKRQFKKVLNEWELTNKKTRYEPKWYSLFNGPTSVNQLVNKIADKDTNLLYGILSMEAHGYQALSAVKHRDLTNEDFALQPIRNNITDETVKLTRVLLTSITMRIISLIAPEYELDLIKFAKEIGIISKTHPFVIPKI
ncbi:hypothetical protein BAQ49_15965 [Bacillus proteolyticus]|uniref:Uncharacterized protein n=1 Tax=Bacillus proteolyticus TaxID=2026192 RepID=A0AA44R576_9BACI|nr:DUF5677 domain-containing protein [Bacillus proteolyticus]OJE37266.1 hypothetical protein BAQ49_15965 [Bacillus proteolyticus]